MEGNELTGNLLKTLLFVACGQAREPGGVGFDGRAERDVERPFGVWKARTLAPAETTVWFVVADCECYMCYKQENAHTCTALYRLRTAKHKRHRLPLRCVGYHQAKGRVPQYHFTATLESKPAFALGVANRPVYSVDQIVGQLPLVPTVRHLPLVVTGATQIKPQANVLQESTREHKAR
jgi:hypothetical protein